jgi:hypothetical protein
MALGATPDDIPQAKYLGHSRKVKSQIKEKRKLRKKKMADEATS